MWKPEHRLAADRRGVREVLNGIFYVLWTGCQWKALPKDLPPKSTVPGVRVIAERLRVNPSTEPPFRRRKRRRGVAARGAK